MQKTLNRPYYVRYAENLVMRGITYTVLSLGCRSLLQYHGYYPLGLARVLKLRLLPKSLTPEKLLV
jgi:hypothetical protein